MKAAKAGKMLGKVYKGYIYKNLLADVSKFVMSYVNDIPFDKYADKKFLLRKVGLKQRAPVKAAFGSFSLLLFGAAAGALAGLLLAPKTGKELRPLIKDRAMSYFKEEPVTQAPATA